MAEPITKENFDYAGYLKDNKVPWGNNPTIEEAERGEEKDAVWAHYQKAQQALKDSQYTTGDNVNKNNVAGYGSEVVKTGGANVINGDKGTSVADATKGQQIDPATGLIKDATPMGQTPTVDPTTVDGVDKKDAVGLGKTPTVTATPTASTEAKDAQGYDVAKTEDKIANNQMEAAKGTVSDKALVDPNVGVIDTKGLAEGKGPVGEALNKFASVDLSNIIDTSTAAGKAMADKLGVNGYVDSKATVKGQLDMLQAEFQDADGNPRIPIWAQGSARNVSKIAAFSGMTGTAATAAMANAIMESSISVANADAQFFQTLTVKNLDNQQQQTINTANILAQMEMKNADNRLSAAITNSQAFLAMDLKNLDNEQQARVINNQARVQSILEDAKAVNTERMFVSQSQNEMTQFYDQLNNQNNQFNASQALDAQKTNAAMQDSRDKFMAQSQNEKDMFYDQLNNQIKQFNAAQTMDADKYNATMQDSREKFYKEMQFNIDVSNAKWRQTVQLTEDQQAYEAAATDVKNMVDISTQQLNRIWDQADAQLDYAWKTAENDKNRAAQIAVANIQAKASKQGEGNEWGKAAGKIAGSIIGGLF